MTTSFQAETRIPLNTSRLRDLRKSGRLPGIVFGKNTENEMIHIPTIQFQKWLKQGTSGFIELQFEEKGSLTYCWKISSVIQLHGIYFMWIFSRSRPMRSCVLKFLSSSTAHRLAQNRAESCKFNYLLLKWRHCRDTCQRRLNLTLVLWNLEKRYM